MVVIDHKGLIIASKRTPRFLRWNNYLNLQLANVANI
jgi:hypothetical protein